MNDSAPVFLDTNILVYTYDTSNMRKFHQARDLVEKTYGVNAVISTQVVAEFCNVMTKKRGIVMTPEDLHDTVRSILWPIVAHMPDLRTYETALQLHNRYGLSFYDALIVQAALDLGCTTLYSEDLQPGQTFGSLSIVNPFA